MAEKPFVFVNYISTDRDKVEAVLKVLEFRGFEYWYDKRIETGKYWDADIKDYLARSSAFLGFISHNYEARHVAIGELQAALKKRKESRERRKDAPDEPEYPVILVMLDRGALTVFPDNLRNDILQTQYIRYWQEGGIAGGLTEGFINKLAEAPWPREIIDEERRCKNGFGPWQPGKVTDKERKKLQDMLDDAYKMPWRSHYRLDTTPVDPNEPDGPEKLVFQEERVLPDGRTLRFFRVSVEQLEKTAVYPVIMDNQWIPREISDSPELLDLFWREGLTNQKVTDVIIQRQREEIFRALLHNWQIVVNRASILNSPVFTGWYQPDNPEYSAFQQMMGDDSIVVYLYREDSPVSEQDYDVSEKSKHDWANFCLNCPETKEVSCLRLDWESDESNRYETARLLGGHFQNFCLTTAQDTYRIDALMAALGMNPADRGVFRDRWREVQRAVQRWDRIYAQRGRSKEKAYTREQFYKDFLVLQGSDVNHCRLDPDQPFAWEMKQVADFVYANNLPAALHLVPAIPPDTPLTAFLYAERSVEQGQAEISGEELDFAASEFFRLCSSPREPDGFLGNTMPTPEWNYFGLDQLLCIRESHEWRHYMRKLTDGKTRSRLNELDYHNIPAVWIEYREFLAWMECQPAFQRDGWHWRGKNAAVSVLYHFEETTLAAVYERDETGRLSLRMSFPEEAALASSLSLNRKTALWIDYVCGNVLEDPRLRNLLLTEIRLFEGMTRENGRDVFNRLLEGMKKIGFVREEIPALV